MLTLLPCGGVEEEEKSRLLAFSVLSLEVMSLGLGRVESSLLRESRRPKLPGVTHSSCLLSVDTSAHRPWALSLESFLSAS